MKLHVAAALFLLSLGSSGPAAAAADLILRGSHIITMNPAQPQVEAVAVKGGRIVAVGASAALMKSQRGKGTRVVDLGSRALLPGFIDAHSHIAQYDATWGMPVLSPPPVGDVGSVEDIVDRLRRHLGARRLPQGTLVLGHGYDDSLLAERRHPTRADLDRVSTVHPVVVIHASGHLLVANSQAMRKVGVSRDTPDPAGGLIRRDPAGEPDGVMEELAGMPFLALLQRAGLERRLKHLGEIQRFYASHGVTTAQDGISMPEDLALLGEAARRKRLILDVVAYPRWDLSRDVLEGRRALVLRPPAPGANTPNWPTTGTLPAEKAGETVPLVLGGYRNRFRMGGIKISADGSPQGKTAFLTAPYVHPPHGQPADYRGYPTVTQEELDRWFDFSWTRGLPLIVHCNGDAAADQMIAAVRKAVVTHGPRDMRPVMIHAQMIRHDQVDAMAELGIVPSFFTAHTFFWGDWHRAETVGPERAAGMSPAAYAQTRGIAFTNHTDAPVVPPDQLMLVWTAVNRVSRSGVVVGPEERITPLAALQAITVNAARQYFEERDKGSLEPGKLADLVILDRNPLEVDPMAIRDIRVLETLKEGRTIYRRR
jgi:predicted amidohydrolase YtcJ